MKKLANKYPVLKKLLLWIISPLGQAKPRLWVKVFLFPFYVKKGKHASISRRARIDLFPYNNFYLGSGSTIEDFCTVNNGVGHLTIGEKTRIGIGSVLIGPVQVGNNIRLAQNVVISGLNHNYQDVSSPICEQGVETKPVFIGDNSWIGANAVILPGVFVGKHTVVAAGSVVTKNVPSYCVVAGNPARIIKKFNSLTGTWDKIEKSNQEVKHSIKINF